MIGLAPSGEAGGFLGSDVHLFLRPMRTKLAIKRKALRMRGTTWLELQGITKESILEDSSI